MTIKEAWELYNQVDNKLKKIINVASRINKRHQDGGAGGPFGEYIIYPDEMSQIMELLEEYYKIVEERKNALVEGSVE